MTLRVASSSVFIAIIMALALVSFRLSGSIWIQNSLLESATWVANTHLIGSQRMADALVHLTDFDEYKRRSGKALSSSEKLFRSSTELVDLVHDNVRQLVILLLGVNAGLVLVALLMYAKLRSYESRNSK